MEDRCHRQILHRPLHQGRHQGRGQHLGQHLDQGPGESAVGAPNARIAKMMQAIGAIKQLATAGNAREPFVLREVCGVAEGGQSSSSSGLHCILV